jgi:RNase P/RNase MRP subunit POP5
VPFEYQGLGYKFKYSLSDKMRINEEYIEIGIISELDVDHEEFKEKLRKI